MAALLVDANLAISMIPPLRPALNAQPAVFPAAQLRLAVFATLACSGTPLTQDVPMVSPTVIHPLMLPPARDALPVIIFTLIRMASNPASKAQLSAVMSILSVPAKPARFWV